MKLTGCRKGSLTVESAIVLPFIICIIISIAFIMRIAHVHSVVQHALNDSANELSTYSYLYSISNIKNINDQVEDISSDKEKTAVTHLDVAIGSITSLGQKVNQAKEAASNPQDTDLDEMGQIYKDGKADVSKLKSIYDEIKGHPNGWKGGAKKEVLGFATLAAHGLFEKGKEEITEITMKIMMRKHIATDKYDENTRLLNLNVEKGYEGLDFTGTRLFKDKRSIDIIVTYRIKPFLPINILPDIKMVQRAYVMGWMDGDGKYPGRDEAETPVTDQSTIWDLPVLKRGSEFQKILGANVLNSTDGAVDKYEPSTGNAVNIRSIDITLPSFGDLPYLKRTIKTEMDKTLNYTGKIRTADSDGKEAEYDIKSREVLVVIPEGSITKEIEALGAQFNLQYAGKVKLKFQELFEKKTPVQSDSGKD
jgi:hypothetical protein